MKRNQLAIAVKEREYTRRLAEYIRDSSFGERWQVSAFTHSNACKQYVKQGYAIDFIAAEPELLQELQPELAHIPAVTLVSRKGETGGRDELLQYQSMPLLMKGISERFDALRRSDSGSGHAGIRLKSDAARLLTVHSASGGVGKTTLALHLAYAASSRGLRVFYLNLERWDTSGLWLNSPKEEANTVDGLSELLYVIKAGGSTALAQWIAERRKFHSLLKCDYLPGFRNAEDRMSLSAEDAATIVDAVTQSGHYDQVIVDMDDGLENMHVALLEKSDHNFWVASEDDSVIAKLSLCLRYGRQKWGEKFIRIVNKSELVRNRTNGEPGGAWNQLDVAQAPIVIPEVKEWRNGECRALLSSSTYRAAADKLLMSALRARESVHAAG